MSYYPKSDSHVRAKINIALELWNYATKKELNDDAIVDTFNLAANRDSMALKAGIDKLDSKVACVVKIKLVFLDWFYYDLKILIT